MNDWNTAAHDGAAVVIDMQHVMQDMQIDEEGYFELVAVFLGEVASIRESIARAPEAGRESFTRVCHELGTTLGVLGAFRGQGLAQGFERALRAGEPLALSVAAATLLHELDVVTQFLAASRA